MRRIVSGQPGGGTSTLPKTLLVMKLYCSSVNSRISLRLVLQAQHKV